MLITMMRRLGCVGIAVVFWGMAAQQLYAQTPGTFSLPNLMVSDCSSPAVSISTTEAGGTLGYDFDISFDPQVLAVANVGLGTLTSDCEFAANFDTPGELAISIACTLGPTGAGTVAAITFVPTGVGTSDLTFVDCSLDEQDCTNPTDGAVSMSGCPSVNVSNSGSGAFGLSPGRACVVGRLVTNGAAVASAATTIGFDATKFGVLSCSINPSLTGLGKSMSVIDHGPGVREISVSGGATAMPTGHLFVCTFSIASAVAVGPYALMNAPASANGSGTPLPTSGVDGSIGVISCPFDCDGDNSVGIAEVVRVFNGAGGPVCNAATPAASCPAVDTNNNGNINIAEVVGAFNNAGPCP